VILYDHPTSSNALKVRFLAAELGLELERRTITMGQPRPPEYVALNPLGGIPTLDDDGFVLAESHAILRYLADREGADALYPRAPRERARVEEFLDRFATRLRSPLFRHEALALGYDPATGFVADRADALAAAAVVPELAGALDLLERVVDGPDGAVLGRFTIADCALAPILFRTTVTGLPLDGRPKLQALTASLLARPAWAHAEAIV